MRIGIISDTHDHIPHLKQAVEIFKDREVDLVIHSGDFCSPFMIPLFEGLNVKGIYGNNDGDKYLLKQKFDDIEADLQGEFFELNTDDLLIAVYHGTYEAITEALRTCQKYDVVISGHTHQKVQKKEGKTLAVNPGTAHGFGENGSIAILETETRNVDFIDLEE